MTIDSIAHKTCTYCKESKEISEFPINDKRGYRKSWCRECYKLARKLRYDPAKQAVYRRKQRKKFIDTRIDQNRPIKVEDLLREHAVEAGFNDNEQRTEEWRDVLGFEGVYFVSNLGRVIKYNPPHFKVPIRILQSSPMRGYPVVHLWKAPKNRAVHVHVLVAEAFIGPRPEGKFVNHIDSNRANPRPENLEYVTQKENMQHAKRMGRLNRGSDRPHAVLNEERVLEIRKQYQKGLSISVLATLCGVTRRTISQIVQGLAWTHV